MRKPKALSFSSLRLFEKNPEEFYLRYLADTPVPRPEQTKAMSIGSGFDALVKSELYYRAFGNDGGSDFSYDSLYESQVDRANRDWCREESRYVFNAYQLSVAYADLCDLLDRSTTPPRFEIEVSGEIGDVPVRGFPDFTMSPDDTHVIGDWKCRGYVSKYSQSPTKGYSIVRDGWDHAPNSRSHGTTHKLFRQDASIPIPCGATYLEDCDPKYADQLSIYHLLSLPHDSLVVGFIDELCCKPSQPRPLIRVAQLRGRVSEYYRDRLVDRLTACWNACQSGYVFWRLSREDNDMRCRALEKAATSLQFENAEYDAITRPTIW